MLILLTIRYFLQSTINNTGTTKRTYLPGKQASDQFFQAVSIYHHPLADLGFFANDYSPKIKWK